MYVRRVTPVERKLFGYRRSAAEKQLRSASPVGKVWKAHDHLLAHAQQFGEYFFRVLYGLHRLRQDYASRDQTERFQGLEDFLPGEASEMSYADAGRQLGLAEGSVKAEVHRLKRRYRSLLRSEVMRTVARREDVEDEIEEE